METGENQRTRKRKRVRKKETEGTERGGEPGTEGYRLEEIEEVREGE